MQDAYIRAINRIKDKAVKRKTRHDKKTKDNCLNIGCRVLLRNRVKGRNKIQDTWNPTVYKVLRRIDGGSAYLVKQLGDDDSTSRTINRVDLLLYPFSDSEQESEADSDKSSDVNSSSDSDEFTVNISHLQADSPKRPTKRVSQRSTKGIHSNPHNLPRSVLDSAQSVDTNPFRDLTHTFSQIGQVNIEMSQLLHAAYRNQFPN